MTDPTSVFIGGFLDGLLAGEFGGQAVVDASFTLKDASGTALGGDSFDSQVTSPVGGSVSDSVQHLLSFDTLLTPGETYEVFSTMTVEANPNGGTAQAIFNSSWEVAISGLPVPEPATLGLLLGELVVISHRRR